MEGIGSKLEAVHGELKSQILSGQWQVGAQLPTEAGLAKSFDCSISTISKAVSLLVHEGFVDRKPRSGTRVLRNTEEADTATLKLDAYAFIFPSEEHEGIRRIGAGFQEAAFAVGRRVMMLSTGTDYIKEAEMIRRLSEFDVRGAVVYPLIPRPEDQIHFSQILLDAKFPMVLTEVNLPGMGAPAITLDGFEAGYATARRLIEQGSKRIGFLSDRAWGMSMRDRYLGYRRALTEAGIAEDSRLVSLEHSMRPDFGSPLKEPGRLAHHYLEQASDVEGVVCTTDYLASALVQAALEKGRSVPDDLRVIGIGDFSLAANAPVPLTTYRIPYEEIGRRAFACLDARLRGETGTGLEILVRGELVVRRSA